MKTISIKKKALESILVGASKDQTRPQIMGVLFDNNTAKASDGHILLETPCVTSEAAFLEREQLENVLKICRATKNKAQGFDFRIEEKLVSAYAINGTQETLLLTFPEGQNQFPDTESVKPSTDKIEYEIMFSFAVLENLVNMMKKSGDGFIQFGFTGEKSGFFISTDKISGLGMPARMNKSLKQRKAA